MKPPHFAIPYAFFDKGSKYSRRIIFGHFEHFKYEAIRLSRQANVWKSHSIRHESSATPHQPTRLHDILLATVLRKLSINLLTPNDPYMGRTAPLTSKHCILYIYSTNVGTEYFKHALYSPFFFFSAKCSLFHNVNLFGFCIIHILYTGCAKIKKNNSGAKGLR